MDFISFLMKMWGMFSIIISFTLLMEKCENVKKTIKTRNEIVKSIFNSLSIHAIGEEDNNVGMWFIYLYNNNKLEKRYNATFCGKCGNYIKEYSIIDNPAIECNCRKHIQDMVNKWNTNITLNIPNQHYIVQ